MEISIQNIAPTLLKPGPIVQQTSLWAEVKDHQGWQPHAYKTLIRPGVETNNFQYDHRKYFADDLLVLTRPVVPGTEMGYAPYGPLFEPPEEEQGKFLEELSESLRDDLSVNCGFIRYDLHWKSPWAEAREHLSEDASFELPSPEFRELRMNYNTHHHALRKSPTNILPSNTIFLDLDRTEQDILQAMKPKTRYNIRLSARKGVKVREAPKEDLGTWYRLYTETAKRNSIYRDDIHYFQWVMDAGRSVPGLFVKLLLAETENRPLAGMILAISGGRATYLYGASSSGFRNMMGSYALQWEAIRVAKKAGCIEYDMFGVAPSKDPGHPMHGLYRFKTGFGGELFYRQGCWDYVFDEDKYEAYRIRELLAEGYHRPIIL